MFHSKTLFFAAALAFSMGMIGCAVEDDHEHDCELDAFQCDGDILQQCSHDDGWEDIQDCSETMQMCHAEMGHCMDMDEGEDDEDDDMGDM